MLNLISVIQLILNENCNTLNDYTVDYRSWIRNISVKNHAYIEGLVYYVCTYTCIQSIIFLALQNAR